jgi:predicted nuclease of predicted toxin-antitoxin system
MRILIDECLNWRLARALTGHYAVSTQKMGWGGIKNGELLEEAAKEFDVFITGDRNLSFQQDVKQSSIAVIVLHGRALRRSARVARKTARAHGTPVYVWKNGKVVAEKP